MDNFLVIPLYLSLFLLLKYNLNLNLSLVLKYREIETSLSFLKPNKNYLLPLPTRKSNTLQIISKRQVL